MSDTPIAERQQYSLDQFKAAEVSMSEEEESGSTIRAAPSWFRRHRRKEGGRKRLPKSFPRVAVVHKLAASECPCGKYAAIPEPVSEKVSERLDIQPATMRVIRHVRSTCACETCDDVIKTSPMPG